MAVIGPDRGNTSSGRGRSLPLRRIVIELTNRCNLRCRHCFRERHAATDDLPLEILEKVVREGRVERGELGELDHFPCWYCAKYLDKVSGLAAFPRHPWARELAENQLVQVLD